MEGAATRTLPARHAYDSFTSAASAVATADRPKFSRAWSYLAPVFLLLVIAALGRVWIVTHTAVAARDSIGFIRHALQFETEPWTTVLRDNLQHPAYPLTVLAVSWPVRQILGTTDAFTMQLSAQLASSLAGLLLVIPMFYLGCELFNRKVGFWGAILFQCLPVSSRALSDGLSEAVFFLFVAIALLMAVRALRRQSIFEFALSGLFAGLAYLTRPEGLLVLAATGLVLLGVGFYPTWRPGWKKTLACGSALALAALVLIGPYMYVIGGVTNKPSGRKLLGDDPGTTAAPVDISLVSPTEKFVLQPTRGPVFASLLAVWAPENNRHPQRWAFHAIVMEIVKAYQYVLVLPLALGIWCYRDQFARVPGPWVLAVLCLLHGIVVWRLAVVVGYVSERHVLLFVLCGIFGTAAAMVALSDWLQRRYPQWLSVLPLFLMVGVGIPETLKPLHANRAGHRAAGLWLAAHTQLCDPVRDPFCWAHYYAGRVFLEGTNPPAPPGYHPTEYVVLEHSGHEHVHLPTAGEAEARAKQGKVVYHWPENKPESEARVSVYAVALR
jgi:Dolichyl-phosphate-mannose-protein mannosyltransferase